MLAPFLKRLPCPEKAGAQPKEFVSRMKQYLATLDLDYIDTILMEVYRSTTIIRLDKVRALIVEATNLDEKMLYTAKEIPHIPINPEFVGKQEHREDAVVLILKIIDILWGL